MIWAVVWLVLIIVFLLVEASTVSLVSLWFAAGSLAALILSLLQVNIGIQAGVFLAVSVALLAALRPITRKYVTPKITKTNVDSLIGATGIVTEDIDNVTAAGQVKVGAMYWTARSTSGDTIGKSTRVCVDRIEGVKAFVTPVTEKKEACGAGK